MTVLNSPSLSPSHSAHSAHIPQYKSNIFNIYAECAECKECFFVLYHEREREDIVQMYIGLPHIYIKKGGQTFRTFRSILWIIDATGFNLRNVVSRHSAAYSAEFARNAESINLIHIPTFRTEGQLWVLPIF